MKLPPQPCAVLLVLYLFGYLSICLSTCLSIYLSLYLSFCKLENEAILRGCLEIWMLQAEKRCFSEFLRGFLQIWKLTTSKTQQICETSFKNGKLSAELTASCLVPMRFVVFPLHLSKAFCLPQKSDARSYEVTECCTCHAKSSNAPKRNLSQEINALTGTRNASLQILLKRPMPAIVFETATKPSLLARCKTHCPCHAKKRLNAQKWSEHVVF